MVPKSIHEPSRETLVLFDTDVLIAGGGPAGILAAISASKNGVRTALIVENSFLGGMAAIGLGMPINNTAPGGIEHGGLTSDFVRLLCQPGPDQTLLNGARIWGKHVWLWEKLQGWQPHWQSKWKFLPERYLSNISWTN